MRNLTPAAVGSTLGVSQDRALLRNGLMVLILAVGAYLRVDGLGSRSLWADEFCTWRVSRMPLSDGLRWGPELTKPPLYQLSLRGLTDDPRPDEWMLRTPACAAGILTVLAVIQLTRWGRGGWTAALCGGALTACNAMQIRYSQEARPYTFLVLGATVATALWHRLTVRPTRGAMIAYVAAAVFTCYSHYLAVLVVGAHVGWWATVAWRRRGRGADPRPLLSVLVAAIACSPLVVHYLRSRSSIFQGLSWIRPPTWSAALEVLEQITFGPLWVVGVLAPALVVWIILGLRGREENDARGARILPLCGVLVAWLIASWFGLLVISWFAHPAMVDRYALPAGIAAIVLPILVAERIHPHAPILIAIVFCGIGIRGWASNSLQANPGFRELSAYVAEVVDPQRELIVLTIDRKTSPDWDDAERLSFEYYPVKDYPIRELPLAADGVGVMGDVLDDPRAMYLVVLWADPFAILEKAGRKAEFLRVGDTEYTQLLFSPYRLVKVAAKGG